MIRVQVYGSSMIISIVFTATMIITLTGFANFGIAQGQANNVTSSSSSLTPEQKDAICNPNNPSSKLDFVNTTESKICGIPSTPTNTTTTMTTPSASANATIATPRTGEQSPSSLYDQGYAKGVEDFKSVQVTTPSIGNMMRADDVNCDSNIDPLANNQDYCSGYQHGYADTFNNALPRK
jgi:cell division protein FtsN